MFSIGEKMEFLIGNPFSTPVGQRVERATIGSLQSEDWGLNIEICDIINETDEGPRDAVKAIKKRIIGNKNFREIMLALTSWADAFRSSPSLAGVVYVYDDLRRRGLEFPMTDLDALSPIHTPNRPTLIQCFDAALCLELHRFGDTREWPYNSTESVPSCALVEQHDTWGVWR
ncbi:hypothetical protein F2P81_010901 [Scophthalmus maximus]|uniref:VHS domain-containing protein n=1 Tax=Scophthalmus maximus TaxID=52904 RepID=A0A6A4SWV3_SCOMX|nr:hypothetical protein F2P81_010901 [Scophthalmus maximus]